MEKTAKKEVAKKPKTSKSAVKTSGEGKPEFGKYIETVGRRKTAVARVRIYPDSQDSFSVVNDRKLADYFSLAKYRQVAQSPLTAVDKKISFSVLVKGGGITAQAEAVRLGLSRALLEIDPQWRSRLKALGFLRRDPRKVERKHYGLRKARRAQQWRKR